MSKSNSISTLKKAGRLYRTVRHLKAGQVWYRLYYGVRSRWRSWTGGNAFWPTHKEPIRPDVQFPGFSEQSYNGKNTFRFLNQAKDFSAEIDWNFMEYGMLWNYNLQYFDFLNQPEVETEEKLEPMRDFMDRKDRIRYADDPYPVSLRCLNWIKFLTGNNISDAPIERILYRDCYLLLDHLEYHLLGNHLWENGCALLAGGIYFDDSTLLKKARQILERQLPEQVLSDGGHFERSPMYHQLLLYRLLDCYNMLSAYPENDESLEELIKNTAAEMLAWLAGVTFKDGTIPHVNDATKGIAPTTEQLNDYAQKLGIKKEGTILGESGYRMIRASGYELFVDVGDVGPDYIPGHAHSDTFSFLLNKAGKPIIVDTGLSTYEEGERRMKERSTSAHNTVMINGEEQTEAWKAFRVGRRAHIIEREETENRITAAHDGYAHRGIIHRRSFHSTDDAIEIKDQIESDEEINSTAYIHFHPAVALKKEEGRVSVDNITISFTGCDRIELKSYQYAAAYNRLEPAKMVEITFGKKLVTVIKL